MCQDLFYYPCKRGRGRDYPQEKGAAFNCLGQSVSRAWNQPSLLSSTTRGSIFTNLANQWITDSFLIGDDWFQFIIDNRRQAPDPTPLLTLINKWIWGPSGRLGTNEWSPWFPENWFTDKKQESGNLPGKWIYILYNWFLNKIDPSLLLVWPYPTPSSSLRCLVIISFLYLIDRLGYQRYVHS